MHQATAFDATSTSNRPPRAIGAALRYLPAAVVVLAACGLLATTAFDRSAEVSAASRLVPAPSAAPMVAAAGDTSLPDASTVFSGREDVIEEASPTF